MWIKANNMKFYAERKGSGAPMLFIGGSGWDLRVPPTPFDTKLVEQFDLVCFDQRGLGRSDKPDSSYTMRQYAHDAIAIMDQLEWKKAHIVGYSFGGMIAQELAIGWTDRIDKLVLAATSPGGPDHASFPIEELLQFDPFERAKRSLEISRTDYDTAFQNANPAEFNELVKNLIHRQSAYMESNNAKKGYRNQLEARSQHNACERLDQIKAQTLILSGDHDGQAPFSGQVLMDQMIQESTHKIVPGGHNFFFENEIAVEAICQFINE